MRLAIAAVAILFSSVAAGAEPIDCTARDHPAVAAIVGARDAFNQGIALKDIDAIRAALSRDVILVTGTDSSVIVGRDAQVAVWQADFDARQRQIYTRTTTCVSLSPLAPIALEIGTWRGVGTEPPNDIVAGRYAAKWRRAADGWQLEAEIFSTERCTGSLCPAVAPRK